MRHIDNEINDLKKNLANMSDLVKEMIKSIIEQLLTKGDGSISAISSLEREVNIQEIVIDDKCLKLIALYQPVGMDLRFITSVMKINSDLERMGDEVVNISQAWVDLVEYPELQSLADLPNLPRMVEIVKKMVEDSIAAFNTSDIDLAESVLKQDDEVDDLKIAILNSLEEYIKASPVDAVIRVSIDLISMVKSIERLGDHSTNISEDVIFMVQGKDIRHPKAVLKKQKSNK
ncbi:MAG: phosphate signaling complex protein PhoU [Elusimicrobiota bacterium]|jgi:phosphate transport system protein|nr:phosphate signaling complex protein PhoU [Elusimicrobiota bacterium]